jgi:hypothetical protein
VDDHRYHLTLTTDGQPVMHGWWGDRTVAERKRKAWEDEHGKAGAHITLADEETGQTLTSWPEQT